ncbi:MAG TPA: FAD-linked oxidase C-terminal domain-containing protein, partial [Pyrinomonadaceae bacterium]|nr:FAD-linked oxidase C-terminal domain-containing protein [Pyrinomonadaceae bacterium]
MDTLVKNLRAFLKAEQVISDPEELMVYECDGLTHYKHRPRAVVFPQSTEEVSEVVRLLARERVSVVPRGAGTGLSGGAQAVGGGVSVEMARMRRILKVDVENRLAVVETGVVNAHVSRAALRHGLHYVPDPSSQGSCTIGGNIAENAGGIHCLKYGTTTDHVLGARVVLSDGRVVELGGAGALSTGYDLLGVFIGSEGTFGIATEATLRLTPVAPSVRTLLADFTNIDDASRAVSAIIAEGIIPAALEMVDGATIRAVEASVFAAGLPTDAAGALLVELDGLEAGIDEEVERVRSICLASGARGVRLAADEIERKKLWAARKGAFGAMGHISPDIMLQDGVVPRSRLPEVLAETYRIGAKYRLRIANVFHAGDGNLHPIICCDMRDADEVVRVKKAGREIVETCVRAGGTITGEHGVGLDKREYLSLVFDDDTLRAMLEVRAAFDPLGIFNPGKIIPELRGCGEARAAVEGKRQEAKGKGQKEDEEGRESNETVATVDALNESGISASLSQARAPTIAKTQSRVPMYGAFGAFAAIVGERYVEDESDAGRALTVSPATVEEACEVLRVAVALGLRVVPAGACTWLDAGNALRGECVVVKTARMSRVVAHEPADLVATAEAGVRLADFNREVGRAGQWLPLDPPDDGRATLGGVAATGLGGAQSFGYGLPRSHVLGMTVALADGRVVRVGGRVVKNVAGYDLCKLFVGSYGTLGLILELTFKLRPRPVREATLVARDGDLGKLLEAARVFLEAQLLPVAVELLSTRMAGEVGLQVSDGELVLLARFAGTAGAVEYQLARAGELIASRAKAASVESLEDDAALWSNIAAAPMHDARGLAWRASVLPSRMGALLGALREKDEGARALMWHAGMGDGRV